MNDAANVFPDFLSRRPRLAGKVAIVTGGGSVEGGLGIGDAIVRLFTREGASVVVVDLAEHHAEHSVAAARATGSDAIAICADVTSPAECERIVRTAVERYGRLDVLVNNVGMSGGGGPLESLSEDVWDRVCQVNLKSAVFMAKAAVPHMVAAGGGSIVNVASISGLAAMGGAAYGPTKAGMIHLSKELTVLYGPQGVRCNAIAPGHLHTAFVAARFTPEARERRQRIAPLSDLEGGAWDVAAAALFLASDESRFVAGVCIAVDGGVTQIGALRAAERMLSPT